MTTRRDIKPAFSLIEMMVGMALLSCMAISVAHGFKEQVRLQGQIERRAAAVHLARSALEEVRLVARMGPAMLQVYAPGGRTRTSRPGLLSKLPGGSVNTLVSEREPALYNVQVIVRWLEDCGDAPRDFRLESIVRARP